MTDFSIDSPMYCSTCSPDGEAFSIRTLFGVGPGTKGLIHGHLWLIWTCPKNDPPHEQHGELVIPLRGPLNVSGLN